MLQGAVAADRLGAIARPKCHHDETVARRACRLDPIYGFEPAFAVLDHREARRHVMSAGL